MSQLLIPTGFLLFLVLVVYAFVREARKQRMAARRLLEELAERRSWLFAPLDEGDVQRRTGGMEAIGAFESPSLGAVLPQNVVSGTVAEGRVWLYEHSRRISEGDAYHWHVCLIEAHVSLGDPVVIRFSKGDRTLGARNPFYVGVETPLPAPFQNEFVVYTPGDQPPPLLANLLEQLHDAGRTLPLRVDLQIAGNVLAVYSNEKDGVADSLDGLEQLLGFARQAVRLMRSSQPAAVG